MLKMSTGVCTFLSGAVLLFGCTVEPAVDELSTSLKPKSVERRDPMNQTKCEDGTEDYSLGYISTFSIPGMRPLYRFSYAAGGFSLATPNYAEGKQAGLTFDRILGYVW